MGFSSDCRSLKFLGVIILCFLTTASKAGELDPITINLTAKVTDGRLVDVGFTNLEQIRLIPGDTVQVTFAGPEEFDAEFWSRQYTWEKTEKRGKKKIITSMRKDAEVTWQARWGAGIDGVLDLGKKKIQLAKLLKKPEKIKVTDVVEKAALKFNVQPDPDRVVDRPDDVPANADKLRVDPPESEKPKVDALIADGATMSMPSSPTEPLLGSWWSRSSVRRLSNRW